MGSSSMDMGSSSMAMASSTMDSMSHSTMGSMSLSSSLMMDMDHSGMSMHMYFTTNYKDYPVLFKGLHAKNAGEAFGIFVLLFFVAFLVRGIEFARNYLEQRIWKNPSYLDCHPGESTGASNALMGSANKAPNSCCGGETEIESNNNSLQKSVSNLERNENVSGEGPHANGYPTKVPLASSLVRDAIRLILCILPDLFGFALMLACMTYTLTYFFAVVIGLGLGRFFFERLSDTYALKPVGANGAFHCS